VDFNRFSIDIIGKIIELYNFCKKHAISPLILLEWLKTCQIILVIRISNAHPQENDKNKEDRARQKNLLAPINYNISKKNATIENTPRPIAQKTTEDIQKISRGSLLTAVSQPDTNEPVAFKAWRESSNSLCFGYFKIFRESKKRVYKV